MDLMPGGAKFLKTPLDVRHRRIRAGVICLFYLTKRRRAGWVAPLTRRRAEMINVLTRRRDDGKTFGSCCCKRYAGRVLLFYKRQTSPRSIPSSTNTASPTAGHPPTERHRQSVAELTVHPKQKSFDVSEPVAERTAEQTDGLQIAIIVIRSPFGYGYYSYYIFADLLVRLMDYYYFYFLEIAKGLTFEFNTKKYSVQSEDRKITF